MPGPPVSDAFVNEIGNTTGVFTDRYHVGYVDGSPAVGVDRASRAPAQFERGTDADTWETKV